MVLPLTVGIFLVWYFFNRLSPEDLTQLESAFARANYSWVGVSLTLMMLSHASRAYRWKYTLKPLGYTPRFINSFLAVMIGYLVNLAVPRLGEVSRCASMNRVEKIPLNQLIGTVIAERVADFFMLLLMITATLLIEFNTIQDLLNSMLSDASDKIPGTTLIIALLVLGIIGLAALYKIYNSTSENKFVVALQGFLKGLIDGIISIAKMKDKWYFIFHTLFIWLAYFSMFWVCFFCLPETETVPIGGVLAGFVLGGIVIAFTNGGIGAYPLAIQIILAYYGVEEGIGGALGWIIWGSQTIMVIIAGILSFALIAPLNKNYAGTQSTISE